MVRAFAGDSTITRVFSESLINTLLTARNFGMPLAEDPEDLGGHIIYGPLARVHRGTGGTVERFALPEKGDRAARRTASSAETRSQKVSVPGGTSSRRPRTAAQPPPEARTTSFRIRSLRATRAST